MKYVLQLIFMSLFFFLVFTGSLYSQDRPEKKRIDLHQKIDQAYQEGRITLDQRVLFKFFPSKAKGKLLKEYAADFEHPFKCGTPATSDFHRHKSELSPLTVNQIESIQESSILQASETYQSPDGHFTIYYETSGSHAVPPEDIDSNDIPDYVEEVAAAADSSYRHEVQRLGYSDPIISNSYEIEIVNMQDIYGVAYYGITTVQNQTTFIRIENDFAEGFPPNEHPEGEQIGAIKATIAHEFKHAIQYEANQWLGETGRWLEMDATLMEEVVYDNVNDYYNYITSDNSIFNNPSGGFYPGSYAHVSWALFFEEKFGSQFWVDVWQTIIANSQISMVDAITKQLGSVNAFNRNYVESQLWHYASGPANASPNFGFEESLYYPSPNISKHYTGDISLPAADTLSNLSAKYFEANPSPFPGGISFLLYELLNPNAGLGVLAYFSDGSVEPVIIYNNQQKSIAYDTNWRWDEIDNLGIVVANGSYQQQTKYAFAVRSIDPQTVRVEQNYPNPFRDQTTIRYSIPEQKEVKLEIFDVLGRKVATLVDESQPKGIYTEQFDGQNYASGIYFYRIILDGEVTTKKMTLVK